MVPDMMHQSLFTEDFKMSFKRLLCSIISVIVSVALIISIIPVSYFLRNNSDVKNIIGIYEEKNDSLDMIYIGGSACYVYWEPLRAWNEYGYTSYNVSADALPPQAIKYLMIESKKTQSPKLWLIDLRPFQYGEKYYDDTNTSIMYHETAIRNVSDSIKYSKNRNDLINASVPNLKERYSYYFDIAKYHSQFLYKIYWTLQGDKTPMDQLDNSVKNPYKGFKFIDWGGREIQNFVDYSYVNDELKLSDTLNELFIDLLEYCKSEDEKVLFIVHSYIQTKEDKMNYNYMKRVIEDYGFDFLNTNDYYKEINLNYSNDMYNHNHVNIFGAEKYTNWLSKYINDNYELPNHKNDASYSEWDDLYINSLDEDKKTKEITANSELRSEDKSERIY